MSVPTVDHDQTATTHGQRTDTVDRDQHVSIGEWGGGGLTESVAGTLSLASSNVTLNGGANCQPAARLGDLVNPAFISSGSPTVCIGG